jgi:CheY-like chemotaxis protein
MATKLLIVDDNDHLREIFRALLQFSGYQTFDAATGIEAIDKACSMQPDLILMDINLPDMSGIDVVRAIRGNPQTSQIPIIGLSAVLARDLRDKALQSGMVDYLEKPISAELLRSKIEAHRISRNAPHVRPRSPL